MSILLVLSAAAIACGGGHASAVTGPSPLAATMPAATSAGGAKITGTVTSAGSSSAFAAHSGGLTVTVTGTAISSSVDGAGHFSLLDVPPGHVDLHFLGSGADAHVELEDVAEQESIDLVVHLSGSTAEVEEEHSETPDNKVELEGRVTAVDPTGHTLQVGQHGMVQVPPGTPIVHGQTTLTLADVHLGDRVHVRGTLAGAAITATWIELQTSQPVASPEPGDDDGDDNHAGTGAAVELQGAIAGKGGTCPNLTFTVSSTPVVTNSSTRFEDAACSTLANGDRVEVKGTKQSNGTVLASKVEKRD